MIKNLNQVTFQGFGTVLPERAQANQPAPKNAVRMKLTQMEASVYQAKSETMLNCTGDMCVLSVSKDGEDYQHFYLDKTVHIRKNIFFSLSVYKDEASVILSVADGQDWLLHQGEAMLYAPDQWHMQYADIGVAPRFVTISFDLDGGDLSSLYNRKLSVPQEAVTLLQQMLRIQERKDPFVSDMVMASLTMLLLVLLRETLNPTGSKIQGTNTIHSENEIIRQAQQYISTHIREKLSVRLIAQQVDVSPSYLTVLFQKNLQISPGEYIRRIKLQESKQMIRENNLNFTEIAAALQYSTVHHFSRQFKEKFGITPTEYARSVR